jgi:hypothetical protein
MSEETTAPAAVAPAVNSKKPFNIEELKRLKLAKKEAKKKLNAAKPQVQQVPPKVLERTFENVPDQVELDTVIGNTRLMTFNVSSLNLSGTRSCAQLIALLTGRC